MQPLTQQCFSHIYDEPQKLCVRRMCFEFGTLAPSSPCITKLACTSVHTRKGL